MTVLALALAGAAGLLAGALLTGICVRPQSAAVAALTVTGGGRWSSPRVRLAAGALRALHIGALVVDRDGAVVLCNPAGQHMGLVRGNQVTVTELTALAEDARRTGTPRTADVRLLHGWLPRDPEAVCARATPLGRGGHVALLVEDVTESRRVADMRRDFVANVSHELKTPVGALSLLAEAQARACDDPAAVRRFADRMRRESDRLARLVTELIDLSRLETAGPMPARTRVPVDEVIGEAVDRTRQAAAARRIDVVTGGDTGTGVPGDREQLVTAVVNLLDNAIQYSPEGTRVDVRVRRLRHPGPAASDGVPDTVEVAVVDRGIGIAETDLDRVFERFYRADPARSRATGGTGLGLAIVKHVAANHGGRVDVHSRARQGSTFTLVLPVAPVPQAAR